MSQVNHNYSHIFETDGHTPWEKLRVMRNFLTDRQKALKIAELSQEKFADKLRTMLDKKALLQRKELKLQQTIDAFVNNDEDALDLEIELLDLQKEIRDMDYDIRQTEAEMQDHPDLTQDCRDEIRFLESFISRLMVECEKTRVPGKSDREMYEINFPEEARARLTMRCVNEFMAHGGLTADTLHYVRRDPVVQERLQKLTLPVMTDNGTVSEQPMFTPALFHVLNNPDALPQLGVETDIYRLVSPNPVPVIEQDNDQ